LNVKHLQLCRSHACLCDRHGGI